MKDHRYRSGGFTIAAGTTGTASWLHPWPRMPARRLPRVTTLQHTRHHRLIMETMSGNFYAGHFNSQCAVFHCRNNGLAVLSSKRHEKSRCRMGYSIRGCRACQHRPGLLSVEPGRFTRFSSPSKRLDATFSLLWKTPGKERRGLRSKLHLGLPVKKKSILASIA